ncbi:MAG: thioesterase family protein [Salinivirgaceae bacterium]|jgi:predicted thioesterase
MELTIPDNFVYEIELKVEQKHTAAAYGSGLAEVFATPAMIALMENAAYRGVEQFLPEGTSTVGMEVNVQHLKATLPNKVVKAVSTVKEVDGRKISFQIEVFEDDQVVGKATHTRFAVDNERFIRKLQEQ